MKSSSTSSSILILIGELRTRVLLIQVIVQANLKKRKEDKRSKRRSLNQLQSLNLNLQMMRPHLTQNQNPATMTLPHPTMISSHHTMISLLALNLHQAQPLNLNLHQLQPLTLNPNLPQLLNQSQNQLKKKNLQTEKALKRKKLHHQSW